MALQKLKAFGRRKSTGNVLDEPTDLPEPTSQESSFKVIPRNSRQNVISFDTPLTLDNRYSHASSAQTRPGQDTAASSLRYSSTSTNPSSVEFDDRSSAKNPSLMQQSGQRSSDILPRGTRFSIQPPRIDSLNDGKPLPSDPFHLSSTRDRALTTSSYASTAVPPKLEQPLPTLGDNSFDDLESIFAGLGERSSGGKTDDLLPQPPQRTFQRADSEPILTPRKPLSSASPDLSSTPTILRINRTPNIEPAEASPDLNRKSTDRLISQNSSMPASPDLSAYASKSNGVTLHPGLSSRQTLDSTSGDEGKKSRVVSFDASAIDKEPGELPKPSSRGSDSSQSFNASVLAYAAEDSGLAMRRMSQRDWEAMKARERYEDKLKLRRGESIDEEGPTIYEDLDDDEDDRRREKRKREKQQADLAVNRQQMRKLVGRKSSDPALSNRRVSSLQTTVSAEHEDPHLLPYAHNLPPITPQDPKRLTVEVANMSATLPKVNSQISLNRSSGDEDDDVPLGILQPHLMQKNAEVNHRVSSAGSLMNGSASITPSTIVGASPNRLSVWPAQPDNRPKSRASNASHLPAFAQRLPAPEQLPFIPGFQGIQGTPSPGPGMNGMGGYFGQQPMGSGASVYGGMTPAAPGPIVYQDGFTGAYHAQAAQGNTFMDTIQAEERRKKSKYKSTPQQGFQRSSTMPNMQSFNPQQPGMPPMPMMDPMMQQQMAIMQQMQMLQQQMAMMSGMNPNMMGMGMDPAQMQQMQMQMQQMNMNGQANGQNRMSTQQPFGNGARPNTSFLGSLPAIPDASPTRSSVLPVANGGLPLGYAPSIAPSERSNVGMPSRYKPVSMIIDNPSIMDDRPQSRDMSGAGGSTVGANSIRATLRPLAVSTQASDDDADNEASGWGAMRSRRSRNKQSIIA